MNKRIFIIHGWSGSPDKDWIPWAKTILEEKGYEVFAPRMPDTDTPIIEAWGNALKKIVGNLRNDDVFIGHSIGCQTILRFLEESEDDIVVDRVLFVAPWVTLTNLESDEMWKIAEPWLETPINFLKVKQKARSFVSIFSDNDAWVPLKENRPVFENQLGSKILVLHHKGHFSEEEGSKELPEILSVL